MTIPTERTRAVQFARDFLRDLLSVKATPRVPKQVRETAHRILRHFPDDWELHLAAKAAPSTWADPEPATAHGLPADEPQEYLLKLTPAQAQVLVAACELYSRIGIGQFEELEKLARFGQLQHRDGNDSNYARLDAAREALDVAKRHLTGMESNASFGIYNEKVHNDFRVAWDLQKVIRHRLSWDRRGNPARRESGAPDGGYGMLGVNYDEPSASSGLPLATMERASDADLLETLPPYYALSRSGFGGDQDWHLLQLAKPGPAGARPAPRADTIKWVGSGESVRSMLALARDAAEAPAANNSASRQDTA